MQQTSSLNQPLSVRYVTHLIRASIESISSRFAIEGELSNVRLISSGHLYFSIKDHNDDSILYGAFFSFKRKYNQIPKDGDLVIVHGKLSIYAQRSTYQFIADTLTSSGIGVLIKKFEETKRRLAADNCFLESRKQQLPSYPKKICIITSPTGAVIHDILRVLSRRSHYYHLIIYPVTVQGETAAREIATAIQQANQNLDVDLLIIARGGGSLEDLWPFNEEILVRAVAASAIPILSAVGHETDYTLCDLAADVRAPTPSAAAEIVYKDSLYYHKSLDSIFSSYLQSVYTQLSQKKSLLLLRKNAIQDKRFFYLEHRKRVQQSLSQITTNLKYLLKQYKEQYKHFFALIKQSFLQRLNAIRRLVQTTHPYLLAKAQAQRELVVSYQKEAQQALSDKIQIHTVHLTKNRTFIHLYITNILKTLRHNKMQCEQMSSHIQNTFSYSMQAFKNKLFHLQAVISSLNPRNVMNRGYAMIFNFNKTSVILSAKELKPKEQIKIALKDGEVIVSVDDIRYFQQDRE